MKASRIKVVLLFFILLLSTTVQAQRSPVRLLATVPPPTYRGQLQANDGDRQVKRVGSYLYVTNIWAGLQIVDISDMRRPVQAAFIPVRGSSYDTDVERNYAYIAENEKGIQVIDVRDPRNPNPVAMIKTPGNAIDVQAAYPNLYVALGKDGFAILDIRRIDKSDTLSVVRTGDWANQLQKSGNLLFVAAKKEGLLIYDVSDPANPKELSRFRTGFYTTMVQVEDSLAYLADGSGGMVILNVSDPMFPVQISRYSANGFINSLNKVGNYAYLTNQQSDLQIVNVSDPSHPAPAENFRTGGRNYAVIKNDIYMFVAANRNTLILIHDNPPRLEPIPPLVVSEGVPFSLQLKSEEYDGDPVHYEADNLPPGSYLDTTTGLFKWTPGYDQAGEFENVVFRVVEDTDLHLSDSARVTLTVRKTNRRPVLPAPPDVSVDENQTLRFVLAPGSDPDPEDRDSLRYRAENLPEGAEFDEQTRTFSWTPTYEQSGVYVVDFLLDDGSGGIDREPVTITVRHVDRPPVIKAVPDQVVDEGKTLTVILSGSDPDREDQAVINYRMKNLPPGADFDAKTHTFSWTPDFDRSGDYRHVGAIIQVRRFSDSTFFDIRVNHVNRPPRLADISNQAVDENQPVTFTVSGSDPDREDAGKLRFSAGNLPPGAHFDSLSRVFRWKPDFTQAGQYPNIFFEVADPAGLTDRKTVMITVNNVNRPPYFMDLKSSRVDENDSLKFVLKADDPDSEDARRLIFSAEGLPKGAKLNSQTGLFRWMPNFEQSGTYQFKVFVTDGQESDVATLTVTVRNVNRPPDLRVPDHFETKAGKLLKFTLTANDPDSEDAGKLRFSAVNLPAGASLDALTGQFGWTPAPEQSGPLTVEFRVTDGSGASDSKKVTIRVENIAAADSVSTEKPGPK